jgi:hypothetical protein
LPTTTPAQPRRFAQPAAPCQHIITRHAVQLDIAVEELTDATIDGPQAEFPA